MKKKTIIKIGLILLTLLILHQVYWYIGLSGNLIIFINNESDIDLAQIEATLDGKKIVDDSFSSGIYDYKYYSHKVLPWRHELEVSTKDQSIKEKYVFYNFFITRIIIDLGDNEVGNDATSQIFYIRSECVYGKFILE